MQWIRAENGLSGFPGGSGPRLEWLFAFRLKSAEAWIGLSVY